MDKDQEHVGRILESWMNTYRDIFDGDSWAHLVIILAEVIHKEREAAYYDVQEYIGAHELDTSAGKRIFAFIDDRLNGSIVSVNED